MHTRMNVCITNKEYWYKVGLLQVSSISFLKIMDLNRISSKIQNNLSWPSALLNLPFKIQSLCKVDLIQLLQVLNKRRKNFRFKMRKIK